MRLALATLAFAALTTTANAQAFGTRPGMMPDDMKEARHFAGGLYLVDPPQRTEFSDTYMATFDADRGLCWISASTDFAHPLTTLLLFNEVKEALTALYGAPQVLPTEENQTESLRWTEGPNDAELTFIVVLDGPERNSLYVTYRYLSEDDCRNPLLPKFSGL